MSDSEIEIISEDKPPTPDIEFVSENIASNKKNLLRLRKKLNDIGIFSKMGKLFIRDYCIADHSLYINFSFPFLV